MVRGAVVSVLQEQSDNKSMVYFTASDESKHEGFISATRAGQQAQMSKLSLPRPTVGAINSCT